MAPTGKRSAVSPICRVVRSVPDSLRRRTSSGTRPFWNASGSPENEAAKSLENSEFRRENCVRKSEGARSPVNTGFATRSSEFRRFPTMAGGGGSVGQRLRTHSKAQIKQIAASIERFGITNPAFGENSGRFGGALREALFRPTSY